MGFFRRRPEPHEVFTPGSPPLEEHNVYVNRDEAEAKLRRYVQRRQVPVVWGEYGVGKTSLVQRHFRDANADGKLVYIASVSGLTLPDVFRTILEHLNFSVTVETTNTNTVGASGGFDVKVVKATASGEDALATTSRLVVTSPTDNAVNRLIQEAGLTVVLDEMHKASDGLREALVDWIKATRTGPQGFTLVLVGTSTDAGRLVQLDPGIDRYVKEMQVDIMTDDEASEVVERGFETLELTIEDDLKERLIRSAAGAPTIVHSLCLDAAETAIADDRSDITESDLKVAVELYLKENGGRLADHYYRGIETTGTKRYRKQVLQAVAVTRHDYATMDDIREGVSSSLGEDVPASALSGPLRALKTPEYGNLLKDVDRDVSGTRIHNLTAFTDPMMKSFVRFMNNLDDTRLMPESPGRILEHLSDD